MRNKKVVIVSSKESFSVRGLELKLKEIGYEGIFAHADIESLKTVEDESVLIVYYMDDDVFEDVPFLVYLKDLCMEQEKGLILVGGKVEYELVENIIPESCITGWFGRPLGMNSFLDMVAAYMSSKLTQKNKKTILIVDDDVAYMQMVREWLKDNYRVEMVNSGIKAIRWLTMNRADLVLLDFEMPVTDGPQIYEMLKSDSESNEIPVMFLTGQQDRASVMRAVELKPVDYLLKSIDRETLNNKIKHFFELQKAHSMGR
ncbi:MAG: response regulator [Acetatifactor sp.]|nr:response regulator [Acetatifactor sp.]